LDIQAFLVMFTTMKTLVIHPKDSSTDFLKPIYENISSKTVITRGATPEQLVKLIESHDRIMMMGHGSPSGLFSVGNFPSWGLIINESHADLLRSKGSNVVCIWCNADQFVKEHNLKGFYTGMFISEVEEAIYSGVGIVPQDEVSHSNDTFAQLLSECDMNDISETYHYVKGKYELLAETSKVAFYNNERLYLAL